MTSTTPAGSEGLPSAERPGVDRRRAALTSHLSKSVATRPWRSQLRSLIVLLLVLTLAINLCDWVVPGLHVEQPWGPFGFAVAIAVVGLLMQPLLVGGAVRLGWLGVLAVAFFGQALIVLVAAVPLPWVTIDDFWTAFFVTIVVGLVGTVTTWFGSAGTSQALVGRLVASTRRHPVHLEDADLPGVVFVQLDGVPFPVLQMAVTAGNVPTMSRWVRGGSHDLHEWTPKLPATTPASQMGILHGVIDGIPAFRWYDRENDRVLVANKSADAAVIEGNMSTGKGLLVDNGVSISNLFTGDAPTAVLTMSRRARGGEATRQAVGQFGMAPSG